MKKILTLVLMLFLFIRSVNAAECELGDEAGFCLDTTKHALISGSSYFGTEATKKPGDTYFKVSDENEILYCSNVVLDTSHLTDDLEPIDQNCRYKSALEKSIIYLYEYGYGENKDASQYKYNSKYLYGDVHKDYYITQTAVWYFYPPNDDPGDEWLFDTESDGVDWNTYWFNAGYDFTAGTYYGKTYDVVTKISALINDAKAAANANPSLKLTSSSTTMNVTSDGKYYISDGITVTGKYLTEAITVTATGVDGAFVTSDKNATSGTETLSDGTNPSISTTVYIKVPVENITGTETNIKINISSKSAFTDEAVIVECNPGKRKNDQSMIKYNPSYTTLTDKIELTVKKYPITISKKDTDGKQLSGASLVIKQNDNVITSWTTSGTKNIMLSPGTYTLEETNAPAGYMKSDEKITFTVDESGIVYVNNNVATEIIINNKPIIITISKQTTKQDEELPGATLVITDKEGNIAKDIDGNLLEWISDSSPKSFHVSAGTYILSEIAAPEGYELSDKEIEFTVNTDGTITMKQGLLVKSDKVLEDNLIIFENTPEPKQVGTGSLVLYTAIVVGVLAIGVATYIVIRRKHK